ncbi:hypothetical protein C8R45DRAFT_602204 [Mycena sanguinolenta]|nr:hypothetical protein C8R45DRAFT_602204 [Mycena sanguinolenta]
MTLARMRRRRARYYLSRSAYSMRMLRVPPLASLTVLSACAQPPTTHAVYIAVTVRFLDPPPAPFSVLPPSASATAHATAAPHSASTYSSQRRTPPTHMYKTSGTACRVAGIPALPSLRIPVQSSSLYREAPGAPAAGAATCMVAGANYACSVFRVHAVHAALAALVPILHPACGDCDWEPRGDCERVMGEPRPWHGR